MQKARIFSSHVLLLAVVCLAAFWSSDFVYAGDARLKEISSDPSALRQAREAGRVASRFCVNCHGANGVSNLPDVPNLAGQNPDYLLEQTRKFGAGKRRDPFMQGLIKALQEEEKIQISLFYASQNPGSGTSDSNNIAMGKLVFTKYCLRCHGERARGDELIPRLAGQHQEYIIMSVTRYRDGTGERQDPQMSSAVKPLRNNEIKLVADYVNSLR